MTEMRSEFKTKFENVRQIREALKNNCFRVYLKETRYVQSKAVGDNLLRVTHAKTVKGKLRVNTAGGWLDAEYSNLVFT